MDLVGTSFVCHGLFTSKNTQNMHKYELQRINSKRSSLDIWIRHIYNVLQYSENDIYFYSLSVSGVSVELRWWKNSEQIYKSRIF